MRAHLAIGQCLLVKVDVIVVELILARIFLGLEQSIPARVGRHSGGLIINFHSAMPRVGSGRTAYPPPNSNIRFFEVESERVFAPGGILSRLVRLSTGHILVCRQDSPLSRQTSPCCPVRCPRICHHRHCRCRRPLTRPTLPRGDSAVISARPVLLSDQRLCEYAHHPVLSCG